MANVPIACDSADATVPAVKGDYSGAGATYVQDGGTGVYGHSGNGYGVHGVSEVGRGVVASSNTNYAIRAHSMTSSGARCTSEQGVGVEGETTSGVAAIAGTSASTIGVAGGSTAGTGVSGTSSSGIGVSGIGKTGGNFEGAFEGIHAVGHDPHAAGVAGYNTSTGPAIYGKSVGGVAGFFDGNVWISGVLSVGKDVVLTGADCAEDFDVAWDEEIEPGEVLTLGEGGRLSQCRSAYDKRVAGVVSGAGQFRPAVVLDRQSGTRGRRPIALVGKVCCKVDADHGAVEVGDLLTTSSTPGHAMKAADPLKAFGSVIGKALAPLRAGRGTIVMLVCLQ